MPDQRTRVRAYVTTLTVGVIVVISALAIRFWQSPTEPIAVESTISSTDASSPDENSPNYDHACPDDKRAANLCPTDDAGKQEWSLIAKAFDDQLNPTYITRGRTSSCCKSPELHLGRGKSYVFQATVGVNTPTENSEVFITLFIPDTPVRSEPSVTFRTSANPSTHGIAEVIQADGTLLTVRYWGEAPGMGLRQLVEIACARLSAQ